MEKIDQKNLDEAQYIIRTLNHDLRIHIINYIARNQPINVTDIYKPMGIEQSVASQHLGYLREIGVVSTERDGRQILYSVNEERLKQIAKVLKEF